MALVEKSCSECAEALNISSSAYSRKLNGLNEFTVKQANELSQYLALTIPETIDIFLTQDLHEMGEKGDKKLILALYSGIFIMVLATIGWLVDEK